MDGSPFNSRHAMRRSNWHAAVAATFLAAVAGCGSSEPAGSPAGSTAATGAPAAPKQIDYEHPVVRIDTSQGSVTLRLDAVRAPGTVRNFLSYANGGFYDNTIVHYVEPGRMIVAGGYTIERSLKSPRQAIRNEAHNGLKNLRGTIAMARDQALIDSATSQFFINLADAPQRDYQADTPEGYGYCVFGEVIEGLDVVERISQSPTADHGGDLVQTPEPPVVVTSIRVVR
jgi:cyclophilin family peptidyl-prolyl cis-trans isomerase